MAATKIHCSRCRALIFIDELICPSCGTPNQYASGWRNSGGSPQGQPRAPQGPQAVQGPPAAQQIPVQAVQSVPPATPGPGPGRISFQPGTHPASAALFFMCTVWPLAPFYNRQWVKGVATLLLFIASPIYIVLFGITVGPWGVGVLLPCLVVGLLLDSVYTAQALDEGIPVGEMEFFGGPYFRYLCSQRGWSSIPVLGVTNFIGFAILLLWFVFMIIAIIRGPERETGAAPANAPQQNNFTPDPAVRRPPPGYDWDGRPINDDRW